MSVDVVVLSECEVNVGTEGHVDHGKTSRVKAMTPGAGGIDPAMLMVAADEGVMPQTREHVGICALLGVRWGVLVVMKAALLPGLGDGGLELLEGELCGLVAGTFREGAALIPVSARMGEGFDALNGELERLATARCPSSPSTAPSPSRALAVSSPAPFGRAASP